MMNIFDIDRSSANTIEQNYEQVIEALLKVILDINQYEKQLQNLKIYDGDKLVYGQDDNLSLNKASDLSGQFLNPQLIEQLKQLSSTSVGKKVPLAYNKRVELGGKVILQSDENGKIVVNSLQQESNINSEQIANLDNDRSNLEKINTAKNETTNKNNSKKEVEGSRDKLKKTGTSKIIESIQILEDSPLNKILVAEIKKLQLEKDALEQERSLYKNLISERLKQPQNKSWWQQTINDISTAFKSISSAVELGIQEFKKNSRQHQIAQSFKELFHLQTRPGENEYQTDNYQISCSGSLYQIKDLNKDKIVMQFRSNNLGSKVEINNLESTHIKDVDTLQKSLKSEINIPTSFAPVGKNEAEYFSRIEKVANALIQYAISQQKDVKIDGKFSYKWQATTDGNLTIEAKDGRGYLLQKLGGQLTSNLSERDLAYFEQVLPKLQPNQKSVSQRDNLHIL